MPFKPNSRSVLALLYVLIFLIVLVIILWISDLSLSVWERLSQQPAWFFWSYLLALIGFVGLSLILIWRVLPKTAKNEPQAERVRHPESVVSQEVLQQRLDKIDENKVDTKAIKEELDELFDEQENTQISLVLFGEISSGKSSLINVLLPDAKVDTSVIGGTTRKVNRYLWQTPLGDSLLLVDIPGFNEQYQELDELARKAVYQGHVALFLCNGDLTATEYRYLKEIVSLNKPVVVVLNKSDRYSAQELEVVSHEIELKIAKIADETTSTENSITIKNIRLVSVQSGGEREVTLVYPDGSEKTELRPMRADLSGLHQALKQFTKQTELSELEHTRQQSVLNLLSSELDKVEAQARQEQAAQIVKNSTKKAVVASLATITPGTDLLVQGYLGINMVKELCQLYDIPAKDMDIEKLLKMLQANTVGAFPILLAVAGNGFKAFPGIGTVAGGLLHSVAYGLIFDSMGKAVSMTLAVQGDLSPLLIDSLYKEKLVENVESRAVEFVKMVLKSRRDS